jgi:diguanylate cyclase (GGDEF)-like protein
VLTGLVNRREFENRLERALKSAKAREASYALCYLDLDQFKIVNDTCGHAPATRCSGRSARC